MERGLKKAKRMKKSFKYLKNQRLHNARRNHGVWRGRRKRPVEQIGPQTAI